LTLILLRPILLFSTFKTEIGGINLHFQDSSMPNTPIDPWYVARIRTYAEEGHRPPAITRMLEEEASKEGRKDSPPAERTVRVYYTAHMNASPKERREWAYFHWPEAMRQGLLPWEASRLALDHLRFRAAEGRQRPTVQEVRWFWQLRLASPSIPDDRADWWASGLASLEFVARQQGKPLSVEPSIEWMLACEPWAASEGLQLYTDLAKRENLSGYAEGLFIIQLSADPENFRQFYAIRSGGKAADETTDAPDKGRPKLNRRDNQPKR
jgi:hypothetical protein